MRTIEGLANGLYPFQLRNMAQMTLLKSKIANGSCTSSQEKEPHSKAVYIYEDRCLLASTASSVAPEKCSDKLSKSHGTDSSVVVAE